MTSTWKHITCDTETNGLLDTISKIWCLGIVDNDTGEVRMFSDEKLPFSVISTKKTYPDSFEPLIEGIKLIEAAEIVVFHYGLGFDKLAIEKFYPDIKWPRIIDTLVLSRLYNPEMGAEGNFKSVHGGHSVAAWTKRLNLSVDKIEYNDWTNYSPLIPIRCEHDILIQREIFLHLRKLYKASEFNYAPAIKLEHDVQEVAGVQEMKGWKFDIDKCRNLINKLNYSIANLTHDLYETLPPRVVKGTALTQIFKKNGEYAEAVKKYYGDDYKTVGGPLTKMSFPLINLGSSDQVKEYLLQSGWQPDEWNIKRDKWHKPIRLEDGSYIRTSPKVTLSSLETLQGFSGEALKELVKSQHRLRQLQLWERNYRADGRISARVNTIGTQTFRMSHITVANVPKAAEGVFLGKDMRSLFTVDEGYVLLGVDQSSLEARIFASILNDPVVIHEISTGDIHSHTRDTMGLGEGDTGRNLAKGVLYATLYGGGSNKLSQLTGIDGQEVIDKLELAFPGLKNLRQTFTEKGRKGWIKGIDGRKIVVREAYRTFNTYIQSSGSIIVKKAYVMLHKAIQKYGLDTFIVGCFHDEIQIQCHVKDKERVKDLCRKAMIAAGEYYKLNCPLDAEVKEGQNWSQTH